MAPAKPPPPSPASGSNRQLPPSSFSCHTTPLGATQGPGAVHQAALPARSEISCCGSWPCKKSGACSVGRMERSGLMKLLLRLSILCHFTNWAFAELGNRRALPPWEVAVKASKSRRLITGGASLTCSEVGQYFKADNVSNGGVLEVMGVATGAGVTGNCTFFLSGTPRAPVCLSDLQVGRS